MPSFTGEAPARASMTTGGWGGEEGGRERGGGKGEGGEREREKRRREDHTIHVQS